MVNARDGENPLSSTHRLFQTHKARWRSYKGKQFAGTPSLDYQKFIYRAHNKKMMEASKVAQAVRKLKFIENKKSGNTQMPEENICNGD